jgi:hypothetical protein
VREANGVRRLDTAVRHCMALRVAVGSNTVCDVTSVGTWGPGIGPESNHCVRMCSHMKDMKQKSA